MRTQETHYSVAADRPERIHASNLSTLHLMHVQMNYLGADPPLLSLKNNSPLFIFLLRDHFMKSKEQRRLSFSQGKYHLYAPKLKGEMKGAKSDVLS